MAPRNSKERSGRRWSNKVRRTSGLSEIAVAHEMFKGLVQRNAPNVMLLKHDKINIGKLQESTAAIVPVSEKSCRHIAPHSQPIETKGINPRPTTTRSSRLVNPTKNR